jgi:phosphatidate cytidylyltransferase
MVALLSTIAVVKLNDTGAYFVGRLLGHHKMTPRLSPGKTWEGSAGGFLLSIAGTGLFLGPIAGAMGCEWGERSTLGWWGGTLVYALLVGLAGVCGDLAVSLLKRDAGIKDSSRWMPGFGGFLDLLDSILMAAPVAYMLWILRVVGP